MEAKVAACRNSIDSLSFSHRRKAEPAGSLIIMRQEKTIGNPNPATAYKAQLSTMQYKCRYPIARWQSNFIIRKKSRCPSSAKIILIIQKPREMAQDRWGSRYLGKPESCGCGHRWLMISALLAIVQLSLLRSIQLIAFRFRGSLAPEIGRMIYHKRKRCFFF